MKAHGLSYAEIGEQCGWSYTKVNRSITEGRRRFMAAYREIESGEECERFAPILEALAGGKATSRQVLSIRPHLRHCTACRADGPRSAPLTAAACVAVLAGLRARGAARRHVVLVRVARWLEVAVRRGPSPRARGRCARGGRSVARRRGPDPGGHRRRPADPARAAAADGADRARRPARRAPPRRHRLLSPSASLGSRNRRARGEHGRRRPDRHGRRRPRALPQRRRRRDGLRRHRTHPEPAAAAPRRAARTARAAATESREAARRPSPRRHRRSSGRRRRPLRRRRPKRRTAKRKPARESRDPSQDTTPTSHESTPIATASGSSTGQDTFTPESQQGSQPATRAPATGGSEFAP